MAASLVITRASFNDAAAQELVGELDAELAGRYPEADAAHFALDAAAVTPPRGVFLVGKLDGALVACGALRRLADAPDVGELKRMYVRPAARGARLGAALVAALEAEARLLGVTSLVLETGQRQPEAITLYARAGFTRIAPFAGAPADPMSVYLGKALDAAR